MRKIEVDLSDILDLASTAETYGLLHILPDLGRWSGPVSDAEIEEHASWYLSADAKVSGYTEEDYQIIGKKLTEWRDKYAAEVEDVPS